MTKLASSPPAGEAIHLERSKKLRRLTTKLAAAVALAITLLSPSVFLFSSVSHERTRLADDAADRADAIAGQIYRNPDLWRFMSHRLEELLRGKQRANKEKQHRLLGPDGETISEWLGTAERAPIDWRALGEADVVIDGQVVARVQSSASLWQTVVASLEIAAVAAVLGIAVFLLLLGLPFRALDRALAKLYQSETDLAERVAELEAVRTDLETQQFALLRARDDAQAANKAKSAFLAMMSHELRTPLNAIMGFSEVIQGETFGPVGTPRYIEYAGNIYGAGKHLLTLINDILDLSKVESGKEELLEEELDIEDLSGAVLKLVAARAERGGISMPIELAPGLPTLLADERKLKQILVNILSNAIKFTPAGGEVRFKVGCASDGGYLFEVTDTGIGMAPEDIPKALSPFGQIGGVLSRTHEGTGLGLPLTKALTELHGSTLEIQSAVEQGTRVRIRFPAARTRQWPQAGRTLATGTG